MRQFAAFVKKEFLHILRDKRTMLILLGMPVMQITLFGFALSVEISNVNVAVVAQQRTETVRQIEQKIDANYYFTLYGYYPTSAQIEPLMKSGQIDVAVIFGDDFDVNHSMQFVIDASNTNNAVIESGYLSSIVGDYFASAYAPSAAAPLITPNIRMLYNPQMKSSYNFVPGIMGLVFILICALMTSVSIVRERETGTMEVLLVSPVKPIYIIFAKMMPYFVISCISLITILLLSYFVLQVPMAGSLLWICVMSLIYIFLSLAIGLLVSTLVRTQVTAMLISVMVFMMPVIMLSGMIFPVASMPQILQVISNVIPARWYIEAIRKLMIQGLEVRYVAFEFTILIGMALVVMSVALKKFKNRL